MKIKTGVVGFTSGGNPKKYETRNNKKGKRKGNGNFIKDINGQIIGLPSLKHFNKFIDRVHSCVNNHFRQTKEFYDIHYKSFAPKAFISITYKLAHFCFFNLRLIFKTTYCFFRFSINREYLLYSNRDQNISGLKFQTKNFSCLQDGLDYFSKIECLALEHLNKCNHLGIFCNDLLKSETVMRI